MSCISCLLDGRFEYLKIPTSTTRLRMNRLSARSCCLRLFRQREFGAAGCRSLFRWLSLAPSQQSLETWLAFSGVWLDLTTPSPVSCGSRYNSSEIKMKLIYLN